MDRRARLRMAAETLLWGFVIGFVVYLVFMVGPYPNNLRFAFQPALVATFLGPALVPVGGAAVAIALSDRWASLPRVMGATTIAWAVYFCVLLLWVMSIDDKLGYSVLFFLPWMLSWLLGPFGYGIARARHIARTSKG